MNLERFVREQQIWYRHALAEVRQGKKYGHWMWFIFPQLRGLGRSETAEYFGISGREEAAAYLAHPVLGERLREITGALLELETVDSIGVFGYTDSMKLRSCMTLFHEISADPLYQQVLDKFYGGKPDPVTLSMLRKKD